MRPSYCCCSTPRSKRPCGLQWAYIVVTFCVPVSLALLLQYASLQEAMSSAVDLYLSLLTDLIKRRGFQLFVHPIPPVLNETRAVVTAFMQILKVKVC